MSKDIHRERAAREFGVPESEVTDEQRRYAKVLNFGDFYGPHGFQTIPRGSFPKGLFSPPTGRVLVEYDSQWGLLGQPVLQSGDRIVSGRMRASVLERLGFQVGGKPETRHFELNFADIERRVAAAMGADVPAPKEFSVDGYLKATASRDVRDRV
ncbi:hypothetical protein WK13_34465 [Burkholderia ubonensis]|uniref:hypothetical protein n=1 Tax=Burkholderia ubonensis TaxID=101571 RepID=UPI00075D243C|nr:hypothetical protein [Burkholderia ubonensis]KVR21644.1 hypothetical protein WK13_34465 [Burkholderia ubonensis]